MATQDLPTPEELRKRLRYDPLTGELVWRHYPQACRGWNGRYADKPAFTTTHRHGYKVGRVNRINLKAHRVIMAMVNNKWPPNDVDHINGNRADNRITNLRCATRRENMKNRSLSKNNKSGYQGVSWCKRNKKWVARIKHEGRQKHIGYFLDLLDAVRARRIAERNAGFHPNHGRG